MKVKSLCCRDGTFSIKWICSVINFIVGFSLSTYYKLNSTKLKRVPIIRYNLGKKNGPLDHFQGDDSVSVEITEAVEKVV